MQRRAQTMPAARAELIGKQHDRPSKLGFTDLAGLRPSPTDSVLMGIANRPDSPDQLLTLRAERGRGGRPHQPKHPGPDPPPLPPRRQIPFGAIFHSAMAASLEKLCTTNGR